jgi:hypothetical protein
MNTGSPHCSAIGGDKRISMRGIRSLIRTYCHKAPRYVSYLKQLNFKVVVCHMRIFHAQCP